MLPIVNAQNMKLGEQDARKVILAQTIELSDVQGKFLGAQEREEIDKKVSTAGLAAAADGSIDVAKLISQRSEMVLRAVGSTHPSLADLQRRSGYWIVVEFGIPLLTLAFGVAADHVANPHRVDLLSVPLMLILAWNLIVFAVLLVTLPRTLIQKFSGSNGEGLRGFCYNLLAKLERQTLRGQLWAKVSAQFFLRWKAVSSSLGIERATRLLHLAAAGWGAGVALSLLFRGFNVEYRAGWESTWLNAEQVQSVLSFMFLPLTFFGFEPFSLQEIASMRFMDDAGGVVEHGRRWGVAYIGLLLIVVVVPRLVLALFAHWRVQVLSRAVVIDIGETYFERLIDRLCPACVSLYVHSADRIELGYLYRVLDPDQRGIGGPLIRSDFGDTLRLVPSSKLSPDNAQPDIDVVISLATSVSELEQSMPILRQIGRPVMILASGATHDAQEVVLANAQMQRRQHEFIFDVLALDATGACWVLEKKLIEALERGVPRAKAMGASRLTEEWHARNLARFASAVSISAEWLLGIAGTIQNVSGPSRSLVGLFSTKEKEEYRLAVDSAQKLLIEQLGSGEKATICSLLKLHAIGEEEMKALEGDVAMKFDERRTLDLRDAIASGAATGAAVGGAVDMAFAGLTLGAGVVIGTVFAAVGGGIAHFFARWNNNRTGVEGSSLAVSEKMLIPLVELAMIRYLVVAHHNRKLPVSGMVGQSAWKFSVTEVVSHHRKALSKLWSEALLDNKDAATTRAFHDEIETIAREIILKLYPTSGLELQLAK
ncbi:MAG: DUF2868 domain-containing protein [Betaproteobacteria bacterium]